MVLPFVLLRGACLACRLPTPPLVCFPAPIPPPPFPTGRGRPKVYFAGGYRPRHPGTYLLTALTDHAEQAPGAREPAVQRKADRRSFLRAAPAAKERGDRGRGTSAFEMVLSPGAGRSSAAGKKETKGFLMQGASPLASPGLDGARHGLNLRSRHPAGAYPRRWWLDQPLRCLTGGLPCLLPANPAVSLLCFSPYPPASLPRRGRGRPRLFHARGFAPCIPGAGRGAARVEPAKQAPGGGRTLPRWRLDQPLRCPVGGLPCWSPADPAVSLLCFPLSPLPPSPAGKGETISLFRRGLPPPAPRHLPAYGTYRPCRTGTRRKGACGSAQWQRNQLSKE